MVKPDIAARQLEADKAASEPAATGVGAIGNGGATGTYTGGKPATAEFSIPVPKDKEVKLTYRVRMRF